MLPSTTTYRYDGQRFIMKHMNLLITLEEANEIGVILKKAYRNQAIKVIIIDNSEATGVWKPEVTAYWNDITKENYQYMKKTVTLTNSVVATMQINRLSKKFGVDKFVRAFQGGMSDEVEEFINQ